MSATVLATVPGGHALVEWFGRTPNFHDAEMQEIKLASRGPSHASGSHMGNHECSR